MLKELKISTQLPLADWGELLVEKAVQKENNPRARKTDNWVGGLKNWFIYILKDPVTNKIHYVGWTVNPKRRLKLHIRNCKKEFSKKADWIKGLISSNKIPRLEIIESGTTLGGWADAERKWIKQYKDEGQSLFNLTDGGDGSYGYNPPPYVRFAISQKLKGRVKSEEHRKNLSLALIGKDNSKMTIAAAAVNKGRKQSKEWVEKRTRGANDMTGKPSPLRSLSKQQVLEIRSRKSYCDVKIFAKENGISISIATAVYYRYSYKDIC